MIETPADYRSFLFLYQKTQAIQPTPWARVSIVFLCFELLYKRVFRYCLNTMPAYVSVISADFLSLHHNILHQNLFTNQPKK